MFFNKGSRTYHNTKRRTPKTRQKPFKPPKRTSRMVLNHRSRIPPVPEPIRIMSRIAAHHGHKSEHEQHEEQQDSASREPKLRLSICTDREEVQQPRVDTYQLVLES